MDVASIVLLIVSISSCFIGLLALSLSVKARHDEDRIHIFEVLSQDISTLQTDMSMLFDPSVKKASSFKVEKVNSDAIIHLNEAKSYCLLRKYYRLFFWLDSAKGGFSDTFGPMIDEYADFRKNVVASVKEGTPDYEKIQKMRLFLFEIANTLGTKTRRAMPSISPKKDIARYVYKKR